MLFGDNVVFFLNGHIETTTAAAVTAVTPVVVTLSLVVVHPVFQFNIYHLVGDAPNNIWPTWQLERKQSV